MSKDDKFVDLNAVAPTEDAAAPPPADDGTKAAQAIVDAAGDAARAQQAEYVAQAEKIHQIKIEKGKQKKRREAAGFTTHEQNKQDVMDYYAITDENLPLAPEINFHIITDMWDDIMVLNKIIKEDKKFKAGDAIEFGCGIFFGLIILVGSLLIAADTAMPGTAICSTLASDGGSPTHPICPTGADTIMQVGSWMTVFGSTAFIGIILWRVFSRIKGALAADQGALQFLEELVTSADGEEVEVVKGSHTMQAHKHMARKSSSFFKKQPKPDAPAVANTMSRYGRQAPAYYAPRSAYHRVATKYGSPNMC